MLSSTFSYLRGKITFRQKVTAFRCRLSLNVKMFENVINMAVDCTIVVPYLSGMYQQTKKKKKCLACESYRFKIKIKSYSITM